MTAPGWYPDPDDPDARRYYDGANWSEPFRAAASPRHPAPTETIGIAAAEPAIEPPSSRRRLWLILAAVGSVIAAAIALPLVLTGNDSKTLRQLPFGTDSVKLAAQLDVCPHAVKSGSVATCTFPDGLIGVGSIASQAQQSYAGAALSGEKLCALVGHGYEIAAPTHTVLIAHVNVADLQKKYGGALYGAC